MHFDLEDASRVLGRTPETLQAWLGDMPDHWIHGNEGPDTFSAYEVLGHLIHGEEVDWVARADLILKHGPAKPFEPFDRFAHRRLFTGETITELLDRFAALRASNLTTLRGWNLGPADLDRTGVHPALGEVTLRQLLATWVAHDMGHLAQIGRVMAKQYAGEVGPWYEYMPVLHPRRPSA
jgi:hypothetical protein